MAFDYKAAIRRTLRPLGWELRRFNPDSQLDAFLWTLFPHLGVNCVLDVGARVGDFGKMLRENDYRGVILSFEPVPENFERLSERAQGDPLWRCYPFALGSADAEATIHVSHGTSLSSFLIASDYGKSALPKIAVKSAEKVPVRRLDAVFDELTGDIPDVRAYLKMDTQGWDVEVFRGASGRYSKIVAMQSELSLKPLYEDMPDWRTALAAFQANGYEISALFAGYRDEKARLSEADCVLVRAETVEEA